MVLNTKRYFIAIDQGSSGTLSVLFDEDFNALERADIPISRLTPAPGLVEHDPSELLASVKDGIARLMAAHPECLEGLAGIGLANQGESFLLWDMDDGKPITRAISWQDVRSETLSARLRQEGQDGAFHAKTGLHLSAEWPALKVREMRERDAVLDAKCRSGCVAFGQLDAWFMYELSGGKHFASDHGTACRSGYYDLRTQDWSPALKEDFLASDLIFPDLTENVAQIPDMDVGIGRNVMWLAGGLDQSVTLIGQRCMTEQAAKVTYGTCCACWMNVGSNLIFDEKLTTSIAWKLDGRAVMALAAEGGGAGNIITWLTENFSTGWPAESLSDIAQNDGAGEGLVFVPAFSGLAAPWWKEARATIFGITQSTTPAHILRAGLDAIAFTVKDMIGIMPQCTDIVFDGGMTDNAYLMQKQADVLGVPILKSAEREGTLMGIAYLCGWSLGVLPVGTFPDDGRPGITYEPNPAWDAREYARWLKSVQTVISYYD
jgi:glycerol kinase